MQPSAFGGFGTHGQNCENIAGQITFGCSQIAFWKLSFIMLTVQSLIWQRHHFSVSGKILEANGSKYNCRQILVHANMYRSYVNVSSYVEQRVSTFYTWQFFVIFLTLFKVKWPPTRGFEGHLVSSGISQSYLRLLPGFTSCSLGSSESEPRKPKSGRPCILRQNLGGFLRTDKIGYFRASNSRRHCLAMLSWAGPSQRPCERRTYNQ